MKELQGDLINASDKNKAMVYKEIEDREEAIDDLKKIEASIDEVLKQGFLLRMCWIRTSLKKEKNCWLIIFPSDKAKISEIKKNLPQLALDSIGKGEEYWDSIFGTISELILPDFREKLLQFFEYPTQTYQVLKSENKTDAFAKKMASEYGFQNNIEEPDNYRNNFFSQLCFTEVYHILKKPASFLFKECVSEEDKIGNNIKLIKEIRSHNRYQTIYYDLIFQIEKNYDSKTFAKFHSMNPDIETFKIFDLEALRELNDRAQNCEKKKDFIALMSISNQCMHKYQQIQSLVWRHYYLLKNMSSIVILQVS